MIKNVKPGDEVYHVDRDEHGYAIDALGTAYLATVADHVISVATPIGCFCIEDLMEHLAEMTREDFHDDIYVHPIADCYETYEEAEIAWKSEEETE